MSKSGEQGPTDLFTPKNPELLALFSEGELANAGGGAPSVKLKAEKPQYTAPHYFYAFFRDEAVRELEKVFDDTSSGDVRRLLDAFTRDLYGAFVRREDPTKLFQSFIDRVRQGDFVDHNRRLDLTLRQIHLRKQELERRAQREAEQGEAAQQEGPKDTREWYRQLPSWAEIHGASYRPRNAFSGDPNAPVAVPDPVTFEYLASITAKYNEGIGQDRVIEVKDESAADPNTHWYRINVFPGFLCIDEMSGDRVFDSEVREGVKSIVALRELQQRLKDAAVEPEVSVEEETPAVPGSDAPEMAPGSTGTMQ